MDPIVIVSGLLALVGGGAGLRSWYTRNAAAASGDTSMPAADGVSNIGKTTVVDADKVSVTDQLIALLTLDPRYAGRTDGATLRLARANGDLIVGGSDGVSRAYLSLPRPADATTPVQRGASGADALAALLVGDRISWIGNPTGQPEIIIWPPSLQLQATVAAPRKIAAAAVGAFGSVTGGAASLLVPKMPKLPSSMAGATVVAGGHT